MSPASSGALEVERYIGACLISSQTRLKGAKPHDRDHTFFQRDRFANPRYCGSHHHHHVHQRCAADGWAGGVPLISFASYQRRGKASHDGRVQQDPRNPLSRLAVHTQGAPLILAGRYHQRRSKPPGGGRTSLQVRGSDDGKRKDSGSAQGADAVSVNSDESSSGSTNSETNLPRIIKPRKRRKKDRKPPHLGRPIGTDDCFSTDSGSPDIDSPAGVISVNPYLLFTFNQYHRYANPINIHGNKSIVVDDFLVSKLKSKGDLHETPRLHHAFEDVEELSKDVNDNQTASTCQCRYCDPSGQIWDVDRDCYSPFLTTPERQSALSFPDIQANSVSAELIECMAGVALDANKGGCPISGSPRDLEVSTEIVTSLNGHRDLEIRFFSSPAASETSKRGIVGTLDSQQERSDNSETNAVNN